MIEEWHQIVNNRDLAGLENLLADDVVLHSPILHRPLEGKAIVNRYLTAAFHTFLAQDFRYVREVVSDQDAVLEFATEIEGIYVNGVDMVRWNDNGKIVDFKVMVRPLKAVNMIHKKMATMLEALDA